jgi:hypothetical protein
MGAAWALSPTPVASKLPVPSDAGPIPNATVNDVDCPTAGNCTAVGDYQDTIGITHAMTLNLTSGTWTALAMLGPADAPDYTFADLNSVSCVSVGNCVAVGDYRVSTVKTEGFYAVETSGSWLSRGTVLPVPADAVANPAQTTFLSVSCVPGGTVCQLVGEYVTAQSVHSVIDTYSFSVPGITGSSQEVSPQVNQLGIGLNSISCTTATDCIAVGAQTGNFSEEATIVRETAGVWGNPQVVRNPRGGQLPGEYLSSVSCVSVGNCVAAGNWLDNNGNGFAETYTETAGTWGAAVNVGQPSNLNNPYVDDISCIATTTSCTIVGALSDNNGSLHAASAQMSSGKWGQLAPATPPTGSTPDHELLAVSCSTGVQCTAVGYYNDTGANQGTDGMAATWTPGHAPGAPTALHTTAASTRTAHLSWTAPTNFGTAFAHYEVFAQLPGGPVTDEGPFLSPGANLTKLSPGGTYHFTVITVATDGQVSSAAAITRSIPATTPTAPKLTRVVNLRHALMAIWAAPKSTGGAAISSYKVTTNCGGSVRSARFGAAARHGTIGGLRSGVACTVRVSAQNRVGTSPQSTPAIGHPLR